MEENLGAKSSYFFAFIALVKNFRYNKIGFFERIGGSTMRKRDPLAKKQAILEAAVQVFQQNGYTRTTMEDICRLSKLSRGTVYWHFKGRDHVFLTLVNSWVEMLYALFQKVRYEKCSTEDKLRIILEQLLLNPRKNMLYLSTEYVYFHHNNPDAIERLKQVYDRYYEIFRILFFEGMIQREFKTMNIEELTASFMGLVEGIYSQQLLQKQDPIAANRAFVTGVEIFLAGIRNDNQQIFEEKREEEASC